VDPEEYNNCVSYRPFDEGNTTGWACYDTDHKRANVGSSYFIATK
jgi:hypothetical protein